MRAHKIDEAGKRVDDATRLLARVSVDDPRFEDRFEEFRTALAERTRLEA